MAAVEGVRKDVRVSITVEVMVVVEVCVMMGEVPLSCAATDAVDSPAVTVYVTGI